MKQPRRWAALPTALLMAASLVFAPQEGHAGPVGPGIKLPDPPTLPMGDPDVPTGPGGSAAYRQQPLGHLFFVGPMPVFTVLIPSISRTLPAVRSSAHLVKSRVSSHG